MRFVSTQAHGLLDYLAGSFLIAAPWLVGFAGGGAGTWVCVGLGAAALVHGAFTDYEMGMVRRLSMRRHLSLDVGLGLLLAASPWLFGFAGAVWLPHVVLGLLQVGTALTTRLLPGDRADLTVSLSPRLKRAVRANVPDFADRARVYGDARVEEPHLPISHLFTKTDKEDRRYEA